MIHITKLSISTKGRGSVDLTGQIMECVQQAAIGSGLCHVFVHHTSASLIISENADPSVRRDLEAFMARIAPDGTSMYEHAAEGPDDMPAHIKSALTATQLSIPFRRGELMLGTWQGIYLWEHRHQPGTRQVVVHI